MAKQTIGIGSAANDGTGDTLRAAFDICNDNFTELYDGSGGLLHKIEGTNFTGSLLVGHSTTGTLSSALGNTGVGVAALNALTSGDYNVAVGNEAGGAITSGERNVLMGYAAGDAITISSYNTAVGHGALSTEDTRHGSTAIGYKALNIQNADADPYNTAVGYHAAFLLTTGVYNTILGGLAGDALTTGNSNIAIGLNALGGEDTGHDSVAIGRSALLSQNYNGSAYNVAIGRDAGRLVDTGIKNTIIGGLAGDNLTTGSNNILIGYDATASAVDVSNEVTIGDSNISTVRIPSDSTLKIGASGDLQLEHVSSNSFIKNTAVGDLYIENQVDDKDIIFRCDDGSGGLATYLTLDGSLTQMWADKDLQFSDNIKAKFGASSDLKIYHEGTDSIIQNYTGSIYIDNNADDQDIVFRCDDGSGGLATYFFLDGSNSHTNFQLNARWVDNSKAQFGNSGDLQIHHDSSNSYISNSIGDLYIQQHKDDGDIVFQSDDGSGGITEYFKIDGGITSILAYKDILMANDGNDGKIKFGASQDLEIFHDGSDNFYNGTTGDMYFINKADDKDIVFQSDDGSGGYTTYFHVDGGTVKSIFSKPVQFIDSTKLFIGSSNDLEIFHDSSNTYLENYTGNFIFTQALDDGDMIFKCDNGSGGATEYFRLDGSDADGTYTYTRRPDGGVATFGNDQDLRIWHEPSNNSSYIRNYTNDFYIENLSDDKDILFRCDDGSGGVATYFYLDGSETRVTFNKNARFIDSALLELGTSGDLQIFHNSTDSFIDNYTGNLTIRNRTDDGDIVFTCDDGSGGLTEYFRLDGGDVVSVFSKDVRFLDNIDIKLGTGNDCTLMHNGTDTFIDNGTGNLNIRNQQDDGDINFICDDGSGGTTTYFKLDGATSKTIFETSSRHKDNVKANFGDGEDLQIYHNGSDSYIKDSGTGNLFIQAAANVQIESSTSGENMAVFNENGAVDLYYDNSKKFETTSAGVTVAGTVDATQSSTSVPVLRLTDDGVCNYDFIFPDDATIKLETSTSSTKTFKLLNAGSGDMNLEVSGSLSKGSGSFKIDHPVKPDTHSLYHSFVESPLTDLIYRGKVKLVEGKASINIDEHFGMTDGTFVALVDDKQVFTTNEDTWDAVKGKVEGNKLNIESQNETFEGYVSWLVIGDRKDKHIMDADWTDKKGKPILEVEK